MINFFQKTIRRIIIAYQGCYKGGKLTLAIAIYLSVRYNYDIHYRSEAVGSLEYEIINLKLLMATTVVNPCRRNRDMFTSKTLILVQ